MDDQTTIHQFDGRPRVCCVPPKLSEETIALLRKDLPKYGPVMKFDTTKRYKFKPTIIASPAEMKRIQEAKRQRLEEEAAGIKRQAIIGYSAEAAPFVDPNCAGRLCPVDLRQLVPSEDIPPLSFQRDPDQERRLAAAIAAAEARAAAAAARPPRPRIFIDPQMKKLMLRRKHEAAEAAATGTKVEAEGVGSGLKRPCTDDSNSGTSEETDADGKDNEWCEDELSWNGSDGELDPSSDLDREWQRRKKQFHSIGYRDGLLAGKEASAQEGFNVGFKESVLVGYDWGLVRGVTGALNCLSGELREKIIKSQETKTKFHNLYESMNNLSTTDALKLYNDDLSKRRVKEGKQNSDGSVLDSYHQQLRSLVLESPAIAVQFRDKSIAALSTGKDPSLE